MGASAVQAGANFHSFATGIGDGSGLYPSAEQPLGQKVCVGKQLGATSVTVGSSADDRATYLVGIYDRVAFIDPARNGYAIKVYINDQLYRVVRPQF